MQPHFLSMHEPRWNRVGDEVIDWKRRDPLFGHSAAEFETAVCALLSGRVVAAYFFGSFGTEAFGPDSDVDMIIVAQTETPFVERALGYPELFDLVPDIDLLVYTPSEFASLTEDPSPGFWTSVVESLRRIC